MINIRKVFKIPIGNMNKKEAESYISKILKKFQKPDDGQEKINLGYGDYWFPSKNENIDEVSQTTEPWYKPDPERDKNDIVLKDGTVFADWNKFTMDELANYLEQKYMFLSSGEALAVMKM